jgi:hypothetical protein
MIQKSLLAILWLVFLWSLWKEKEIPVKHLICLLIALSLLNSTFCLDYRNLSSLFLADDSGKFFTYSTENLRLLLAYGSPFGFNHDFQGGIPSLYLTSCFLELLPFALVFGEAMGYQVMVIFFIIMIPISLFFLMREFTGEERAPRVLAMAATFQLGLWPALEYGMVPAFVAMPLAFFALFFFLRYLAGKKTAFFPLVCFSAVLIYTHIVIWANTMTIFLLISASRLIGGERPLGLMKKLAPFGVLHLLSGLPLWYTILNNTDFFRTEWVIFKKMSFSFYLLSIPRNIISLASKERVFFLSLLFLLWFYFQSDESKAKKTLGQALFFDAALVLFLSLKDIPKIQFYTDKFSRMFVPYTIVFNLALPFILPAKKKARILGVLILLVFVFRHFPPVTRYLETVKDASAIDSTLSSLVRPRDHALVENCAHAAKYGGCRYSHWIGYLQREVGAKFFAHHGNDAHPYNSFRSMYLLNGHFLDRPLGDDNRKEFLAHLKDWSVNKACVWSETARKFFDQSPDFRFLGRSEKYFCYEAAYQVPPEVRLEMGGKGRIVGARPFSFIVLLEDVSRPQAVTISKNFFKFWSAFDDQGRKIPLKRGDQKICFEASRSGPVIFKYRKNIFLNVIVLFTLLVSLVPGLIKKKKV